MSILGGMSQDGKPVRGRKIIQSDFELAFQSGDGTDTLVYRLNRPILFDDVVKLRYFSGDVTDLSGNALASFDNATVINGSLVGADTTPPELDSATVSIDGTQLSLVFSEEVTGNSGITIAASGGAATVSYTSGTGTTTLVFNFSRTIAVGETLTLDYNPGNIRDLSGNNLAALDDFSITNNLDTTAPTLTSATIAGSGTTLTLLFSETITGSAGFTLAASGGPVTATYTSGQNTSSLIYSLSRTIGVETVTLDYTAGNVTDLAGNPLASIDDFSVVVSGTPPAGAIIIDAAWIASAGNPPYTLSQSNKVYWLDVDVTTPRGAFIIGSSAVNIVLDLNGHTITYQTVGDGVPNQGFEIEGSGGPTTAESWDFTGAPAAVRESTYSFDGAIGRWYVKIPMATATNQTIISDWADLPQSVEARAHFLRCDPFTINYHWYQLDIEHSTLGILTSYYSDSGYSVVFTTSATAGQYRLRFTYTPMARPTWQASTAYSIGDMVRPTTPNGRSYMLTQIGTETTGVSGGSEPTWNTDIGDITVDGEVEWVTSRTNFTGSATAWQANKAYSTRQTVRPITPNGCLYTVRYITKAGATSGGTEPTWGTGTALTVDGQLRWKVVLDSDVHIDEIDVVPGSAFTTATPVIGVMAKSSATTPRNHTIQNGTIIQGGTGYGCSAIYLGLKYALVKGVTIETYGLEAAAVSVGYSEHITVRECNAATFMTFKHNRHQISGAIAFSNCSAGFIECVDNVVDTGEGWMGIMAYNSNDVIISNNTVNATCVTTNHPGILASQGNNLLVSGNTIIADPGQGIRIGGTNSICENNTIVVNSVAPNWDDGRYSIEGILLNDYGADPPIPATGPIIIRNNSITINGANSPHYSPDPQTISGIVNVSAGPGIVYENNTIVCNKIDPEVIIQGIDPGSVDVNDQVIWRGNTITSDKYGLSFGPYSTQSRSTLFENTTFIKGPNAGPEYAVLFGEVSTRISNTIFKDTILQGGGTLRSVASGPYYATNPPLSWSVRSSLDVTVRDATEAPINGATVVITDVNTNEVYSGLTNSNGMIPTQDMLVYTVLANSTSPFWHSTNYYPYTISVTHPLLTEDFVIDLNEAPKSVILSPTG